MLQYVSLEYFYVSKPLSNILFSVGAVRFIEKKKLGTKEEILLEALYSGTVTDRILNSLSLKSYDISYRFSFPSKEHPLSGKQTFSTCIQSRVSSDNKVHWCEGETWDAA